MSVKDRYFMIDEHQLRLLERIASRLHTEKRMSGDEMRDLGHSIENVVQVVRQLELPEP